MQINEDRSLVLDAREHILAASDAISQAGAINLNDLIRKWKTAEGMVSLREKWAKSCYEGEMLVKEGEKFLASGNWEDAANMCTKAQILMHEGLKCESLRASLENLQLSLNEGKFTILNVERKMRRKRRS